MLRRFYKMVCGDDMPGFLVYTGDKKLFLIPLEDNETCKLAVQLPAPIMKTYLQNDAYVTQYELDNKIDIEVGDKLIRKQFRTSVVDGIQIAERKKIIPFTPIGSINIDGKYIPVQGSYNFDTIFKSETAKELSKKMSYYYGLVPQIYKEDFGEKLLYDNLGGLYDSFSHEQVRALYEYYKVTSKAAFNERNRGYKFEFNFEKAGTLINISERVDDWEYAGMLDTGENGGGCCDLGHPLRYVHYAYSPSLDKLLRFGCKCVSDFFTVTKDIIAMLDSVQKRCTAEVVVMGYLQKTINRESYFNTFSKMLSLFDSYSDKNSEYRARIEYKKMCMLRDAGICPPDNLISELRDWIKAVEKQHGVAPQDKDDWMPSKLKEEAQLLMKAKTQGVLTGKEFCFAILNTVLRQNVVVKSSLSI